MKKLLFLIALFLSANNLTNAQYVFTGNGPWANASNWLNGAKPPLTLPITGTISIQGTATTSSEHTSVDIYGNKGTVTIESGGSLTISTGTQFSNEGNFIVYGTYINKTVWENYWGAHVIVYGTVLVQNRPGGSTAFTNRGFVTIKNNGQFTTESSLFINCYDVCVANGDGSLTIENGGTFTNMYVSNFFGNLYNQGTLINTGLIKGNPTINGNLNNPGTIAPGSSPGVYTVNGNYIAGATSIHNFEIGGTTINLYDRINSSGTVALNGTLNVSLINGFSPAAPHDIPIITGTNITGTFSNVNIPAASGYQLVYSPTSLVLRKPAVLPVKFISFEGKKHPTGRLLKWMVGTEDNVSHYEVERSHDGRIFQKIGEVNAFAQNMYTYLEHDHSGFAIYRIKAVDRDGKFSYSVMIRMNGNNSLVVLKAFPIPALNEIILQHPSGVNGSSISIIDMQGKIMLRTHPSIGTQQSTLDISTIPRGTYIIKYEVKTADSEIIKFQKL